MSTRTFWVGLLFVMFALGTAHANCPDRKASCVLHEEGVALLLEGKHQPAAEKFAAAIAAEPSARSYLGYAQSVEALGQIALAYDTMVLAQRLSTAEVKGKAEDPEVKARAERIKYKLAELRAKIGFVWLRVPEGVRPQRVIAVQREGEGQLSAPLTQWTAVAPGNQVLIVTLDDGSKLRVETKASPGTQDVVVIPIAVPVGTRVPPGRVTPPPGPPQGGFPPPPKPSKPIYKRWWFWTLIVVTVLVIASTASSGPDDVSGGGFKPLLDRPVPPTPDGVTLFRF